MGWLFWIVVALIVLYVVARQRPTLPVFTAGLAIALLVAWFSGWLSGVLGFIGAALFVVLAVIFNVKSVRLKLVSQPLLRYVRAILPPMSDTERVAIDAGTVWWEAELFRGAHLTGSNSFPIPLQSSLMKSRLLLMALRILSVP